jgi:hypothetical protein
MLRGVPAVCISTPAGSIPANMKLGAVAMTKHEIIAFLKDHKQEMQEKFGATRIGLAGSYARGDATEESDIDIIVELHSQNRFRSFFYLQYFLQDALGKRIDLATESGLKPIVRQTVFKDILYV